MISEGQVKQLQKENGSLLVASQRLRASVHNLENQINYHLRNGCQVAIQQQTTTSDLRDEVNTSQLQMFMRLKYKLLEK